MYYHISDADKATIEAALIRARDLAEIARDWHLFEVEIDGQWVRTSALSDLFDKAITALQAIAKPVGVWEPVHDSDRIVRLPERGGHNYDLRYSDERVILFLPRGFAVCELRPAQEEVK